MTAEDIRRIVTADYEKAKILLEQSRFFRVTSVDADDISTEFDAKTSPEAVGFFENVRATVKECYLDVTAEAVEFNGREYPSFGFLIADQTDAELRTDVNYLPVQQFNRAFIGKLLEATLKKFTGVENRLAGKILAELLQIDYPL